MSDRAHRRRQQRARTGQQPKIGSHTHEEWCDLAAKLRLVYEADGERLAAMRFAADPALADQVGAAVADASRAHDFFAAATKIRHPDTTGYVYPDEAARTQVYAHYLRITAALADGAIKHCPHVSLRSPVPAIAAVFGDRIDCLECFATMPLHRPLLSQVEEHTCDLCRGYVPLQTMHQLMPQVGAIVLIVGVCESCVDRMDLDSTRRGTRA